MIRTRDVRGQGLNARIVGHVAAAVGTTAHADARTHAGPGVPLAVASEAGA